MTDERQMRFEEWADSEGVAQDLGDPERCGDGYMARDWDFLWRLWLARDAEVQALREALGSIVHASNNWAMPVKAFDVTGKLADIARAALAGGETGEAE